jgi:hypothetical protein
VATVAAAKINLIQNKAHRSSSPVVETAGAPWFPAYRIRNVTMSEQTQIKPTSELSDPAESTNTREAKSKERELEQVSGGGWAAPLAMLSPEVRLEPEQVTVRFSGSTP